MIFSIRTKIFIIVLFIFCLILPLNAEDNFIKWESSLDYPAESSLLNMKNYNNYDIEKNGFIYIKDGHFFSGNKRIRFFGTNLTSDANFLQKDEAEKIASQLAGLGINIVRLHHMDGKFIWGNNYNDYSALDDKELDKLDYFIFQLKKRGIYINLNLHVSWQYTNDKKDPIYNLIRNEDAFKYGKGLDIFIPELIAKQKKYAAMLLNHKNKYTGYAYKDDPVTAVVEINNENSFYRNILLEHGLDLLPENTKNILDEKWQKFILEKYKNFPSLKKSWIIEKNSLKAEELHGIEPLNENNNWKVQITDPKKGTIEFKNNKIYIALNYYEKNKFFQFYKTNIKFKKDEVYTIALDIKGERNSTFNINAIRSESPWDNAGLSKKIKLSSDEPQTFLISFLSSKDLDKTGRITLSDFDLGKKFTVNSIKIFKGKISIDPLKNIREISRIKLADLVNLNSFPDNYINDCNYFFKKIEFDYWKDMISFLKKDIGVKVPITGTQIDYSNPELSEIYDYVDIHQYWQHPSFPGKHWDAKNFFVKNISMVPEKKNGYDKITLFRIKDKPYSISEYNHPYPNSYTSETSAILSVISKLQDYDAVYLYTFFDGLKFDPATYFSFYTKFICKSIFQVSSFIFRDENINSLKDEIILNTSKEELSNDAGKIKRFINPYLNILNDDPEINYNLFKANRVYLKINDQGKNDFNNFKFSDAKKNENFIWENGKEDHTDNFFKLDNEYAKIYIGWNIFKSYNFKNINIKNISGTSKYFQFTAFNKEGKIGEKGKYIISLSGREFFDKLEYYDYDKKEKLNIKDENYGKKFMAISLDKKNIELLENFSAELSLTLDKNYKKIKIFTIDKDGNALKDISYKIKGNELTFSVKEQDQSIIYCIDIND